jgi:hypothetical protein
MPDLFTNAPRPGTYSHDHYPHFMFGGISLSLMAAEQSLMETTNTPWCYFQRRVTWQERENAKFEQEIYTPPPFSSEPWFDTTNDHFVHVSIDDPTKVAFTENAGKGDRDIQQRMAPGRYLQKFYAGGEHDTRAPETRVCLTPKQVAFYSEWFLSGQKPVEQHGGEVQFATSPEAIVDVYRRGPDSCMRNCDSVRVYGAGDLAIAYVEDGDKVISRALCWPEKKVFGRVYPTPENYWMRDGYSSPEASRAVQTDLHSRLREMGFRSEQEGHDMVGARVLKIEDYGRYVGPYLDDQDLHPNDNGCDRYLVLEHSVDSSVGDGRNTDGYFGNEDQEEEEEEYDWVCEQCDEGQYDGNSSYEQYISWNAHRQTGVSRSVCSSCNEYSSFVCEVTEELFSNNHVSQEEVLVEQRLPRFDHTLDIYVEYYRYDTQTWNEPHALIHAFYCSETNQWVSLDIAVELRDGTLVSPESNWFTGRNGFNYLMED